MPGERKQVGTKLDPDIYRQIRILALQQGRTAGSVIDEALREYIAKQRKSESKWTK
jgi:predicted transcriptional regulator